MSQPTEQTVSIQQVYADAMLNQIAEQRNQAQNQVAALTGQVRVLEAQVQELQGQLQGGPPPQDQPVGTPIDNNAPPAPPATPQPDVEPVEPTIA